MQLLEHPEHLYKVGTMTPSEAEWCPRKIFARETLKGVRCLSIASGRDQTKLLELLLANVPEPYWLLYVLVVPRGEGADGSYQSEGVLTRFEVRAFLNRFRPYIERDGRHNIWVKSVNGPELLVLDRHNLLYAYGFEDEASARLVNNGWCEAVSVDLPDPHSHHYQADFDLDARDVLAWTNWDHSPLREQDY